MNALPNRKTPAHFQVVERDFRSSIVFLSVCAQDRSPIFADAAAYQTLLDAWRGADAWHVGRYTIMPDHWDRQLRREESYAKAWAYVRENPVRKGLASNADAWPYQGELNVLWWHD